MALGLTGGIATGKSTAAAMLEELGAEVIDADRMAREVLKPEGEAYEDVVAHFGGCILQEDGRIDRKKLAGLIFSDARQRQKLEKLTHPHIISRIKDELARRDHARRVVAVIPLLFESHLEDMFEEVWVISCSEEIQIERLKSRDNLSRQEALDRISAQMDLEEKESRADRVIYNTGSEDQLRQKLRRIWKEWTGKGMN